MIILRIELRMRNESPRLHQAIFLGVIVEGAGEVVLVESAEVPFQRRKDVENLVNLGFGKALGSGG